MKAMTFVATGHWTWCLPKLHAPCWGHVWHPPDSVCLQAQMHRGHSFLVYQQLMRLCAIDAFHMCSTYISNTVHCARWPANM